MLKLFVEFLPIYLFIFEIIFLIALGNRTQNTARIADCNHIGGNILCYNTARSGGSIYQFHGFTLSLHYFIISRVIEPTGTEPFFKAHHQFPFSMLISSKISSKSSTFAFAFSSPLISSTAFPSCIITRRLPYSTAKRKL